MNVPLHEHVRRLHAVAADPGHPGHQDLQAIERVIAKAEAKCARTSAATELERRRALNKPAHRLPRAA